MRRRVEQACKETKTTQCRTTQAVRKTAGCTEQRRLRRLAAGVAELDSLHIIKDRSGSMFVYILIILTFLLTFSGLVGEYYRIHSIQTHLEYELQRAVNIAVEEAMQDSWRQDKVIRLDTAKATQNVHDYLRVWLDLNGALEKWQGGTLIYSLQLSSVSATENPPRMYAGGKLFIPSQYPLFVTSMEIPFNISSRNGRLD